MNVLPIVTRELHAAARKPAAHRMRLCVSLLGLVGVFGLLWFSPVPDSQRGRQLYLMVSGLALLWALIAGVLLTADSINEEQARGTLGLLLLTNLRPIDVLLGKISVCALNGTYALIGLLPLLAVPLMFGGVMAWQVTGHAMLVLVTLMLSMSVGVYASTRWREPGIAMARGFGVMATVVFGLPLATRVLTRGALPDIALGGPLGVYLALTSARATALTLGPLLVDLLILGGLAVAFLLAASRRLKRTDVLDTPPPEPVTDMWGRPKTDVFGRASPPPSGLIETDPIMWLLWRRNRFPRADRVFLVFVLLVGVPMGVAAFCGGVGWWPVLGVSLILHFSLTSHMATQSCKRIASEEERAALELLTTTPRAARGTLESYHRAFQQLFQTQFWWLAGVYLTLIVAGLKDAPHSRWAWFLLPMVALCALFAGRYATSWVGLNASLRHGRYHRAMLTVQSCVQLPTWGYLAAIVLMTAFRFLPLRWWWWWWVCAGWVLVGALVPWLIGSWHRQEAVRWVQDHGGQSPLAGN